MADSRLVVCGRYQTIDLTCLHAMNTLSSLGTQWFLPQKMADVLKAADAGLTPALASHAPGVNAGNDDVVSLSALGLDLAKRSSEIGNASIDMAQNLVSSFARQLFGDAATGMTVSFDSASASATVGLSAALEHRSGGNGSRDSAALNFQESSDFVGKGQITTADGHRYTFEVEVHYQATLEMATSSTQRTHSEDGKTANILGNKPDAASASGPQKTPRPAVNDLNAHFPGTVAELFRMLDSNKLNLLFQSPSTGQGKANSSGNSTTGKSEAGSLTLRLLDLVKMPATAHMTFTNAYGQQVMAAAAA